MKFSIAEKRPHIYLIGSFLLGYIFILTLATIATSLRIIEFAFFTVAIGFGPAYLLRKEFRFQNFIGWIFHAGAIGMLFTPFIFLLLGWLKFNIIFEYSTPFLLICSAISLFLLWFSDGEQLNSYLAFKDFSKFDAGIFGLFLAFTALLTLINFSKVEIHWDAFTFWGVDSKFIFENHQLRDQLFHTDMILFRYTSFHPIYHVLIYDLYGGVVEQFASWVNVYLNFLAMGLIYLQTYQKNLVQKSLVASSIFVVSFASIPIVYMFSLNADVLVAFLLLVYFIMLTRGGGLEARTYYQRIFLLLLIAVAFYFIKSPFLYFTIILIALWFLYDISFIRKNYRKVLTSRQFIISLFAIVLLWTMRIIYFANVGGTSDLERSVSSFSMKFQPNMWETLGPYFIELLRYMLQGTPYLVALCGITFLSIFLIKTRTKPFWYQYLFSLLFFMAPIAPYLAGQRSLQSESLLRYSAIVMYLFPLVLNNIPIPETKLKKIASIFVVAIVFVFTFFNLIQPTVLQEPFSISSGRYQTELVKYQKFATRVIDIAGENARIIIIEDLPPNIVTNRAVPAIFIRYYLMYNSVGGLFTIPKEDLLSLAVQTNSDYILLLSNDGIFTGCAEYLDEGHDYLIDVGSGSFNQAPGSCLFSQQTLVDLGKGIR